MKRLFCLMLVFVMAMGVLPVSAKTDKRKDVNPPLTYQYVDYHVNMPYTRDVLPDYALPASYSSVSDGRVGSVRNQGIDGTCWAFSATGVCETALQNETASVTDLSTMQLVNFFYSQKYDPLGNASGDKTENLGATKRQRGGNHLFTMWSLAGWTNGAPESVLPYNTVNGTRADNGTIDASYANLYDIAHLQNAMIIPYDLAHLDNIKSAIAQYGSVGCSYYHNDSYYNEETGAYYCNVQSSNHAVVIVGWNDSYAADRFLTRPAGNGAWLIKNSWGTGWGTDGDANPEDSGKEGYFWLSYYDTSLLFNGQVYAYDFKPTDVYQYNYQYDGSCGIYTYDFAAGDKVGAIYRIAGQTASAERVDAVGIGMATTDMTGTARIYVNPTDGDPESGVLAAEIPFATSYAGFYTFEIPDGPVLNAGDTFGVVFTCDNAGEFYIDYSYSNGSWIRFTANTANDKTYVIAADGVHNLGTEDRCTARVKAYTNDADAEAVSVFTVTFNANGGSAAPAPQTKTAGTTLNLSTETPVRDGYTFLGWSVDPDAETPEYLPGDPYSADEDAVLYAVWEETVPEQPDDPLAPETDMIVTVDITTTVTGKKKKQVTTYEASIGVTPVCTEVASVAYTQDSGTVWHLGTSFTSSSEIRSFRILVMDTFNQVYLYEYRDGTVSCIYRGDAASSFVVPQNAWEIAVGETRTFTIETTPSDAFCLWESSASEFVNVTFEGNTVSLEGVSAGNGILMITDRITEQSFVCSVSVNETVQSSAPTVSVEITKEKKTYSVRILAETDGTPVRTVEYLPNDAGTWTAGTSFSYDKKIKSMMIRITTADGSIFTYLYDKNGTEPII